MRFGLTIASAVLLTQGLVYPQEKPTPAVSSGREWTEDLIRAVSLNAQLEEIYMRRQWQLIDFPTYDRLISETTRARTEIYKKYQSRGPEVFKQFNDIVTSRTERQTPALRTKFLKEHGQPPAATGTGVPAGHGPSLREIQQREGLHNTFWSLVIWTAIISGVIVLFRGFLRAKKPGPAPPPTLSDNFGTANWAPKWTGVPNPFYLFRGVFFGKSSHPNLNGDWRTDDGAPICSLPENHTLVVARTGTGKGTRVLVPTLLRYTGGAMIVIDPKGELAAISARARLTVNPRIPFHVEILNPWGILKDHYASLGFTRMATYNPLEILDRDDPNAVANAQSIAATICMIGGSDKDQFWQSSAANILAAVLLWITDQPGEKKTLARAREITSHSRKQFTEEFMTQMASSGAFDGAIRELISPYIDLAQETYSGVMSNLSEAMKFLSDPQVKNATAGNSFSMKDLLDLPITVYIVIPPERIHAQRTWLKLIIAAATMTFKNAPLGTRKSRQRCMFLIDEFAALGRLQDFTTDISTLRGAGIDYTICVQGINQLKDLYKEGAGTILSNCAFQWFCNVNDLESAKYLSETLGKKTVQTVSTSESSGANRGGATEGESTTVSETGRNLLNPDEILNLGRDVAIVINPKVKPQYVRTVDYWDAPDVFESMREFWPYFYWDPPLKFDPNPYIPKSATLS